MSIKILNGDCRDMLKTLPDDSFDCCVTSPPYWGLRDYGVEGQIGLEPTMQEYLDSMVAIFREVRRVLKPEGTFWLNVGDSYARTGGTDRKVSETAKVGSTRNTLVQMSDRTSKASNSGLKEKNLCMIPNRLAIALQEDGWYVRSEIIWHKPNPMPESVRDRPTSAHEKIWLLTKSDRYFYDYDAIAEPVAESTVSRLSQPTLAEQLGSTRAAGGRKTNGNMKAVGGSETRNARNVWTITTKPFKGAHFAVMPPDLAERCIKAGCPEGGMVLDPFGGAGTTGVAADRLNRNATLIELNSSYAEIAVGRINAESPLFRS